MPGISPNEGEEFRLRATLATRDLQLVLITNASIDDTLTFAGLTQPSGGGYAPILISQGTWTFDASGAHYPQQTFTATGGATTPAPTGYALISQAADPLGQKVLAAELDPSGAMAMPDGATYRITLNISGD